MSTDTEKDLAVHVAVCDQRYQQIYPPYPTDGLRYYIDYTNAKWVTTPPTPT